MVMITGDNMKALDAIAMGSSSWSAYSRDFRIKNFQPLLSKSFIYLDPVMETVKVTETGYSALRDFLLDKNRVS